MSNNVDKTRFSSIDTKIIYSTYTTIRSMRGFLQMKNETINILRKCGITTKYNGYHYLPEAVEILYAHFGEQICITKDVYPIIAQKYSTSVPCVEHCIRTVIGRCWINNRECIKTIVGYEINSCPTNMEFLDCLVFYIASKYE